MVSLKALFRRTGVVSGLQQRENTFKYVLLIAGPFYVVWGSAMILDKMRFPAEIVLLDLGLGFAGWIAGIAWYHASVKMDVAGYSAFDASKWRFDETTVKTLDVLFKEDEMEYIGQTKKGRDIYRIGPFTNLFSYYHPTEGEIEFNRSHLILPFPKVPWEDTFFFGHTGQVWFKSVPTDTPNCEGVTFHVSPNWDCIDGEWIPTILVADSHMHFLKTKGKIMGLKGRTIKYKVSETQKNGKMKEVEKTIELKDFTDDVLADEVVEARIIAMQKMVTELRIRVNRAESDRSALLRESFDIDKSVRDRLEDIKRRHKDIMRVTPPWTVRFVNAKTAALLFLIGITCAIIYWFFGG